MDSLIPRSTMFAGTETNSLSNFIRVLSCPTARPSFPHFLSVSSPVLHLQICPFYTCFSFGRIKGNLPSYFCHHPWENCTGDIFNLRHFLSSVYVSASSAIFRSKVKAGADDGTRSGRNLTYMGKREVKRQSRILMMTTQRKGKTLQVRACRLFSKFPEVDTRNPISILPFLYVIIKKILLWGSTSRFPMSCLSHSEFRHRPPAFSLDLNMALDAET
jgi:hypothetical protein